MRPSFRPVSFPFSLLKFQESILKRIAYQAGKSYRVALPEEEAKGIDGFTGEKPISIKPITYKAKKMLPETIEMQMIYYEKLKDGIKVYL